jgi:hypothetical protein
MAKPGVRFLFAAGVCIVLLLGAFFVLTTYPAAHLQRTRARLAQGAKVGWSRAQVIDHLGKPGMVVSTRKDLDYWRRDRSYEPPPTFPFQKEVLVYTDYVWRLYVYIGKDAHVTHVQMART